MAEQEKSSKNGKKKDSSYAHRNSTGVAAPLEIDSDSDFNPGEYVPEDTRRSSASGRAGKGKGTSKAKGKGRDIFGGTKRGSRAVDSFGYEGRRSELVRALGVSNPLAQFFNESLDLHSASEDSSAESSSGSGVEEDDEEEEDEEDYSGSDSPKRKNNRKSAPESPPVLRTLQAIMNSAPSTSKPTSRSNVQPPKKPPVWTPNMPWPADSDSETQKKNEEESVTESETEPESHPLPLLPPIPAPSLKRKTPPRSSRAPSPSKKRRAINTDADSSVTESESDIDIPRPPLIASTKPTSTISAAKPKSKPKPKPPSKRNTRSSSSRSSSSSSSETESDSDTCLPFNPSSPLKPRPAFPLPPGGALPPLILSESPTEQKTQVPASINTFLREYQREGIKFLWKCYSDGRGGWLGDDMGLGKTIQVISFLSAIMHKHGDKRDEGRRHAHVSKLQDGKAWKEHRKLPPANEKYATALIVAPSSVLGNWEREIHKWGYFDVGMYVGLAPKRAEVLKEFEMGRLDILLVSFDTALRSINLLSGLPLSCLIIDEAHRLKNPRSKLTRAFHSFQCVRRFGLSGTVIQNNYMEMHTELDWCCPGRLGEAKAWKGYVVKPLTEGQSRDAGEGKRERAYEVALTLKDKILPLYFLRRTKDIIKDQLPKKHDQVVFCPLTAKQAEVYQRMIESDAVQDMVRKDELCDCGSGKKRAKCCHPYPQAAIFTYISVLIKVSNHLGLILPAPNDTAEQVERNRELAAVAFPDSEPPKFGPAMLVPAFCGKWATLDSLLRAWKEEGGNKVLIFTKSVKLLDMLEFHLNTQSYSFVMLHGATKQEDRMPLVDRFQDDPNIFVFLISTLAGGTGLNLTSANKVVIFDPNWNPAHDLQAMDRAYRIGQARDVYVYRLLGAGSVEELIYARQIYKQQQMQIGYNASLQTRYFKGVQGDTGNQGELFGLKNIFKLHDMGKVATRDMIEEATLAEFSWELGTAKKSGNKFADVEAKVSSKNDFDVHGLGALLLDDAPPPAEVLRSNNPDDLILNQVGISYTHDNEKLLEPSKAEEERLKRAVKMRRKRKSGEPPEKKPKRKKKGKEDDDDEKDKPVWPPVRKKQRPASPPQAPTPVSSMGMTRTNSRGSSDSSRTFLAESRQKALVFLGLIETLDDVHKFAEDFKKMEKDEQAKLLSMLDDFEREGDSE